MKSSAVLALTLALALGLGNPLRAAEHSEGGGSVSALDLIELQISYTTLLARYYRPIAPRALVDGARTGVAAELDARGIRDAVLPFTPPQVDFGTGGDLIDSMVLRSIVRYGRRVDSHRLIEAAVAGELGALHDPYTVLFRPQQFKKFNAFLGTGTFGGIGAVLSFDAASGRAPLERVLADGPAKAAGLQPGDAIVAIDGQSVASLGAQGMRDALRGKIGTPVRIDVGHAGGVIASYTLIRAAVRDPEVETREFGSVGYVRLTRFGDKAGDDVDQALDELKARGALAVILDLRDNGGGFGDEATAVASAFVPTGTIFTLRERTGTTSIARASGQVHFQGPLAVLVNGDTASAAEIVAGAIADDGLGTLFGTRTFGKGLVQSIFPLPDGSALKVTTARYTTPKGRDLDRAGINPDVVVAEPAGSTEGDPVTDPQLAAAQQHVLALLAAASGAIQPGAPLQPGEGH